MRVLIATIAFGLTLGVLFLLSNHGPARQDSGLAQIAANNLPSRSTAASKSIKPTKTPKPTRTPKPTPTPRPTPTPLPTNSSEINLLSSVPLNFKVKSTAEVKIQTLPKLACSIKVVLPTGSVSGAQGLGPQIADSSGVIDWKWTISWNTKPGNGKVAITCSQNIFYSLPFTVFQ